MSLPKDCQNINERLNNINYSQEFSEKCQEKIKKFFSDDGASPQEFNVIKEKFRTIYSQNEHRGKYGWFNPYYTKRVELIKQQLESIIKEIPYKSIRSRNSIFFNKEKRSYFSRNEIDYTEVINYHIKIFQDIIQNNKDNLQTMYTVWNQYNVPSNINLDQQQLLELVVQAQTIINNLSKILDKNNETLNYLKTKSI